MGGGGLNTSAVDPAKSLLHHNIIVTNDWSEARVDPIAALFIQRGGQTGKYQAVELRATQTRQSRNQRQSNGSGQAADREDYQ